MLVTLNLKTKVELPSMERLYPALKHLALAWGWDVIEESGAQDLTLFRDDRSKWGDYLVPRVTRFIDEIQRLLDLVEGLAEVQGATSGEILKIVLDTIDSLEAGGSTVKLLSHCSNDGQQGSCFRALPSGDRCSQIPSS